MTATADAPAQPASGLTPNRISRLRVPALEELSTSGVSGFFARQQREEGLTSNWFRALSLNEGISSDSTATCSPFWVPTAAVG
jgi:hypothetical protein